MRAMVLREHGDLDRLRLEEDFPDPKFGDGDALIRVKASSLNYHDVFTRRGMPGIKVPMPAIMGLDVAGEVLEVGRSVTGWKPGDRVVADPVNRVEGGLIGETTHGGLAELCRVRAHQLIRIPDGVTFEQAAALPIAYGTAHRMMVTNGKVGAGETVLILGASGGVGVCCLMLAKSVGARVIACGGSDEKCDRLKRLGADHTINYNKVDFMGAVHDLTGKPTRRGPSGGVDVVVNYTGGDTWVKSLRCLRRGGRLLTCGATAGFGPQEDIRYIWVFELNISGTNGFAREDITALLDMVAARKIEVVIDRVYPLAEAAQALAAIEERKVFGKVVVRP